MAVDKWDAEYTVRIPGQRLVIVPPCQLIEVTRDRFEEYHVVGCQCEKARGEQVQRWIENHLEAQP